jgi:hypothetical protein
MRGQDEDARATIAVSWPIRRRARLGTTLTFSLAASISAVWVVRTPALVDKLHLDPRGVGIVVLFWGSGALVTMQFTQRLVARFGTKSVLRVAGPASTVTLAPVGFAPSFAWLLAASVLFGMAFGVLDIAMNTQAAALERAYDRHLMNGTQVGASARYSAASPAPSPRPPACRSARASSERPRSRHRWPSRSDRPIYRPGPRRTTPRPPPDACPVSRTSWVGLPSPLSWWRAP